MSEDRKKNSCSTEQDLDRIMQYHCMTTNNRFKPCYVEPMINKDLFGISRDSLRLNFTLYSSNISYPERAPLKEVLGGQYTYREGEGKCCDRALIKAAG